MVVTHSIERVLVGAALNVGEKIRKLLVGSQRPRRLEMPAVAHARRSGSPAPLRAGRRILTKIPQAQ